MRPVRLSSLGIVLLTGIKDFRASDAKIGDWPMVRPQESVYVEIRFRLVEDDARLSSRCGIHRFVHCGLCGLRQLAEG
jgi:hypothetical protein